MPGYHDYDRFVVEAVGHELTIVGKPGVWSWDQLDAGTAALLEVAEIEPDDAVLDLGCGTGVIGVGASVQTSPGHVTLVDCNVVASRCAKRTLAANDAASGTVLLADGVSGLASASFDVVLSHLPRGKAVQEELIRGAAWALRPGGRFYLVANKRVGVRGCITFARELFGRCGVIRQKQGYHVALSVRPSAVQFSSPASGYSRRVIKLRGVETTMVSKPGVFSWNQLDDGTKALVSAMEMGEADAVLDLGCGAGLAGLAAARAAPQGEVVLVDADVRAVESARRTLMANGITNAVAFLSDCCSDVQSSSSGRLFDVVITNPPFHQERGVDFDVARQFVVDAARVLRIGGRLFLVANRFLRYGEMIGQSFGNVATAYVDNRYHVLTAVRG